MSKETKKTAFVAMKFEGDPWNDKRYVIITEVLQEAGFEVIRGDSIKSSGEVMREVVQYLRDSDLVVIDSTGDSHNVSYEIGYCHGIERDPAMVILLRKAGAEIPFNYSHLRHLIYEDLKHLRRLLRDRLNISFPLTDDQFGYVFTFRLKDDAGFYGAHVAKAVIESLERMKFTGRCEYYAANPIVMPDLYTIGLGIQANRPKRQVSHEWWTQLFKNVAEIIDRKTDKVKFDRMLSDFYEMRELRTNLLSRGVAEFRDGKIVQLLSRETDDLSWFESAVLEFLQKGDDAVKDA